MSLELDKSTWTRISFGDAIENVTERVDDPSKAGVDRYVGLEHLDPGVMTVQRWDTPDRVEAQKLRFRAGDVIFGRRRAYQKKVALAEFEGICSAHALVLRARPELIDPDFLPVFLSSDYFLERAISISVGSLSPTVNWRDLRVEEFDLPPLDEQKRLANFLWAAERHEQSVSAQYSALRQATEQFLASRLAGFTSTRRLGEITETRSGPSFPASAVSAQPVEGGVPVIGIPNTKPDGSIDLSGMGYVTGLPSSTATVDETSLILIRTNGNRQRIGNVYVPPAEAVGFAVSAFQFLMRCASVPERDYLFHVLSSAPMQAQMSEAASGTVGLGNLAVRWLNDQVIAWPSDQKQLDRFLDHAEAAGDTRARILAEISALQTMRAAALNDVFGVEA